MLLKDVTIVTTRLKKEHAHNEMLNSKGELSDMVKNHFIVCVDDRSREKTIKQIVDAGMCDYVETIVKLPFL